MKSTIALGVVVLLSCSAFAESEMITRRIRVRPSLEERISALRPLKEGNLADSDVMTTPSVDQAKESDWKHFFSILGVKWPDGSSIRYIGPFGLMVVRNTSVNIDTLEQILSATDSVATQIEVQLLRVAFDRKAVESLLRNRQADRVALLALWESGKGILLNAPRVVTQAGLEASLCGPANSATGGTPVMKVLPELSPDGPMICVTLSTPEMTTSICVLNGTLTLVGGGVPTPDGKRFVYTFLGVRLLDMEGNPAKIDNDLLSQLLYLTG